MSPEQLGWAVGVSGHTVRRIEQRHAVPTPRVQFALAQFFGMRPTQIWQLERRKAAA